MGKHYFLIIALALGALWFVLTNFVQHRGLNAQYLEIGGQRLAVEIADDETERSRGLSGRTRLASNEGMLFVFDAPGSYGFWMKEMNFPIDIIWLDEDWRITGITANLSPDSYPQVFYPPEPVKYVLEVNAGLAAAQQLSIGAKLKLRQK
ncbi:MAG: DUF192 domain-containing protein [Candidatus Vogelbacteria bacterium]|nr:DUF192 domain-containing protein [Candidatus Vogelbacteria bacterium]